MAVFLLIAILIGWARHLHVPSIFNHALQVIFAAASASFFWVVVWAILRKLFRTPVIGADNVFGALCGYIIMGQGFAHLNSLTYLYAPSAYLFDPNAMPPLADWHGRTALFSYYSYSQMLTIGYALVTPFKAPATTLSLLAALSGLFYTAVIVSQLVGMAQTKRKEAEDEK
jgi:small basic protein